MNFIQNVTTAFTIGCSIYASWKIYNNINSKKARAVETHTEYKDELLRNTTDNYENALSWNSSDSMDEEYYDGDTKDTDGLDNKQTEYYNVITVDNKLYENKIKELQKKLTSTSFIANKNTFSINELESIIRDQQKCIKEQRSINSQLLLKLNDTTVVENKLDEYSVDKKWFIQYNTRTNKILKGLVTKISTLKRVNVDKKEFNAFKKNFGNVKKNIMATQSMYKNHFDEKISSMVRKYDKIKSKTDMKSCYTMGLNSFPQISMMRNNCYIPEMVTRNQQNSSFSYQTQSDEIAITASIGKIPVPPPMPSLSTSSVVSPVPPVPPMAPNPPALPSNILDDYSQFTVTKNLLKTVTLTPVSDTPRKIKKPQCMIDASKKKADAAKTAVDSSTVATIPADITDVDVHAAVPEISTVSVHNDPLSLPEMLEIASVSFLTEVPNFPTLNMNVYESSSWNDDDDGDYHCIDVIPEVPNIPLPRIPEIPGDKPQSASTDEDYHCIDVIPEVPNMPLPRIPEIPGDKPQSASTDEDYHCIDVIPEVPNIPLPRIPEIRGDIPQLASTDEIDGVSGSIIN